MAPDEDLVHRIAQGDEQALSELLRRYERPLSHFLYRHTAGRDVEDLYQETWLRVARAAHRFDRRKRFSTWLFQIAVNVARDWHRRLPPENHDVPGDITGPSHLARAEAGIDVAKLLARLPDAQREVVILRLLHDLTEEQVAAILECPKGTVKSRLHNALARLAELVQRERS